MGPSRQRGFGGRRFLGFDTRSWGARLALLSGLVSVLVLVSRWNAVAFTAAENAFLMQPGRVLHGQVWELFSYALLEWPFTGEGRVDVINLVLAVYMVWVFGQQIESAVGTRRFVLSYFGYALAGAVATTLLALVVPSMREASFDGLWVVVTALTVVYARLFPNEPILIGFLIPMAGRYLVWITLGILALEAVATGPLAYVPHFAAFVAAEASMREVSPRRWYLRLRAWQIDRQLRAKARHFTVIPGEKGRKDEPKKNDWLH